MAVFRVEKNHNYTVMSNYHLRDTRLTLKSIGLLSKMLSLTEEWDYTTRGLAAICKEGVDAIGAALKELETRGYLIRRQIRDSKGRITDTEYTIYESPHTPLPDTASPDTENPYLDTPYTGEPYTEKPAQLNKDRRNKEKEIPDESITDTSNPDPIYPPAPVPFPVSWTVKMKKKQKETQDILSYHTQAAGCSDKARAKASGGRQPIEECGRTGL